MASQPSRDRAGSPAAPAEPAPSSVHADAVHALLDDFARANGAVDAIRGAE